MAASKPAPVKRESATVAHCVELLAPLGTVRTKRMFSGWGFYVDELFIALVLSERLYLKTDASTVDRFRAAGCEPFIYDKQGQQMTISYWSAPAEAMDAPHAMEPWARLAIQAALSARAAKPVRAAKRPATSRRAGG